MDTKLARGLTREGFRRDVKNADGVQTDLGETHRPFIERLRGHGKLSKAEAQEALVRVAAFKSNPHHTLFLERFTSPKSKPVSSSFDGAVVGGNFSSGPVTLFGHNETVRSYSLFYDRYSRKSIDVRLLERPIYVREHAVSRFIERSDSAFPTITPSLWPGLLIIDALEFFTSPAIARPFMLPIPQGVFLGVSAMGTPPGDIQGIERTHITASGASESIDRSSVEPLMPIWFMSTFLSLDQMKPSQTDLRSVLISLIERHRAVLMVAHLHRIMSFGGESDGLGLENRFSGDVHAAKADFDALVSGELWLRAIRVPNDSPFVNHFVAQGLLERSSLDSAH
jgi:hypothetical protein